MSSLNSASIIGNLTRDPEMRSTKSGAPVTTFGIATNRKWKDKSTNEAKEEVEFHSIVAWGKLAEICNQYLKKGAQVYIGGRLKTRMWEDDGGKKNYRTEIIAQDMVMLGSKVQASAPASAPAAPAPAKEEEIKIDDLPF